MKFKILALYILSIIVMFMCSCSQNVDTPGRMLRSNTWCSDNKNSGNISLSFKDDNAIISIWDKDYKSTITGLTIVTDNEIRITDEKTLSDFSFAYDIKGDSVDLSYQNKKVHLYKQ